MVLSLLILLAGLASMGRLPLTEYPNVMPPTVNVIAAYPGANPAVIADTVATPLETELNGLAGLQYMGSQSTGDGKYTLRLTFDQGIDPARAETEVQNRVSRALPRLPAEVQRIGVVSEKVSPDMLMVVHLVSPGNRYDLLHLSNFAQLNIRDTLLRVPGVQSVAVWGAGEYSLRVWLDPERMLAYGLTAGDVVAAIREQNMQVAAGSVGQPDARARQQLPLSVTGRLTSLEAFGDIVVRTGAQRRAAQALQRGPHRTRRQPVQPAQPAGQPARRRAADHAGPPRPARCRWPPPCATRCRRCRRTSRRASSTALPTTRRCS